jgi:hypothetical protein
MLTSIPVLKHSIMMSEAHFYSDLYIRSNNYIKDIVDSIFVCTHLLYPTYLFYPTMFYTHFQFCLIRCL